MGQAQGRTMHWLDGVADRQATHALHFAEFLVNLI